MNNILIYLIVINVIGAVWTALDKHKARHGHFRVPEKTLFLLCALGGCPGVYLTMRRCRHKTQHKRFMWGIPAIFALQVGAAAIYYVGFYEGL